MKATPSRARAARHRVQLDRRSVEHRLREALGAINVDVERLSHAAETLDGAIREVTTNATADELRLAAVGLRAGVLQVMASTLVILSGVGQLELVADLNVMIEAERRPD